MNCINNYRDIFEECLTGCKESALVHEPLQMIYTVLVDEALTSFASGQNVRIDAKYECMSGTSIVPFQVYLPFFICSMQIFATQK